MRSAAIAIASGLGAVGLGLAAAQSEVIAPHSAGLVGGALLALCAATSHRALQERRIQRVDPRPPPAFLLRAGGGLLYATAIFAIVGAQDAPLWLRGLLVGLGALVLAAQLIRSAARAASPSPPLAWVSSEGLVEITSSGTLLLPWRCMSSVDLALLGSTPILRVFIGVDDGFEVLSGPQSAEEHLAWLQQRSVLMERTMAWSGAPVAYREGAVEASVMALYDALRRGLVPDAATHRASLPSPPEGTTAPNPASQEQEV